MRRKWVVLAVVCISAVALILAGCSSKGENTATKEAPKENTTTQAPSGETQGDGSLQAVKNAGKLLVGIDDAFPPMTFRDSNNQLVGFDIDMAREIGKRLGVETEWVPTEWNGVILALNSKKFDVIISGMSITDERAQKVDFSPPYINERQVLVVKADNDTIKTKDDVKGLVVGSQLGSTGEKAAKENLKDVKELKLYPHYTEAFMDLSIGRIQALVVDELVGRYYMTDKKPGEFKVVDELVREPFGIAFRKSDKELQKAVNSILEEMKADGTMAAISKKWFGDDITAK